MLQLKLNKAQLELEPWNFQWTPREAELMTNQVIRGEVNKQTNERAAALRSYMPQAGGVVHNQSYQYSGPNGGQQPQRRYQQSYAQPTQDQNSYQNYGNNSQNYQGRMGYSNQSNQYGQGSGAGLLCWVCDKINHQKKDCPTLQAYIDKGWYHLDDRSVLN
ncbi:hypothetical protein P3342_004886 [Pyrenophora teres f. teres]|nr:hypothetical protein P3342_004886 [Pyrenophora teres f. teres]